MSLCFVIVIVGSGPVGRIQAGLGPIVQGSAHPFVASSAKEDVPVPAALFGDGGRSGKPLQRPAGRVPFGIAFGFGTKRCGKLGTDAPSHTGEARDALASREGFKELLDAPFIVPNMLLKSDELIQEGQHAQSA